MTVLTFFLVFLYFFYLFDLFYQIYIISCKVTALSYDEDATECHSTSAGVAPHAVTARDSGWRYREVTPVSDSLEWTFQWRACQRGWAHRSRSGVESPPAGYDTQLKVECSLRNIIMMFVTADNSARADDKRGASDFRSQWSRRANGSERRWRRRPGGGSDYCCEGLLGLEGVKGGEGVLSKGPTYPPKSLQTSDDAGKPSVPWQMLVCNWLPRKWGCGYRVYLPSNQN